MDDPFGKYGESGRLRLKLDAYSTPIENTAGLTIGLERLGIRLAGIGLDPFVGSGQHARAMMALNPGLIMRGSDIAPDPRATDLLASTASVDATDVGQLTEAVRLSWATFISGNPPYSSKQGLNHRIWLACHELLRRGTVDMVVLMATSQHAMATAIGWEETAAEPHFNATVVCQWRTIMFADGKSNGKFGHVWHVSLARRRRSPWYRTCAISKAEALARLHPERRASA
jgi:hypothetical protein